MPTLPTGPAAAAAPDRAPRQPRGYITSYGAGRVCAYPDCSTALSRYNKSELCYPHAEELDLRRRRLLS